MEGEPKDDKGTGKPWLKEHQFKPGQTGNAKGRPVVNDIKRFIKERLAEETAAGTGITKLEAIISRLLKKAFDGDYKAMELAIKYGYGNPTQAVEITGKDGQNLITHDFSKLSSEDIANRITQLEAGISKLETGIANSAEFAESGEPKT